ncbi:ketosteroid isomerase-like protein [Bradyrhizobium sp. GM24.11]
MSDDKISEATLADLNRNYVRAVDEADVAWFDANLASDFRNTNPDGALIDRLTFLAQIGRGSTVCDIREHDVIIRVLGDFAIIHARTSYRKPDGSEGAGRYTDDWQFRDRRWQCVSAHVSRA